MIELAFPLYSGGVDEVASPVTRVAIVGDTAFSARIRQWNLALEVITAKTIAGVPDGAAAILVANPTKIVGANAFHVVRPSLPDEMLEPLLRALATGAPLRSRLAVPPASPGEARRARAAFTASRKVAAAVDVEATERLVHEAIVELCDVDRAYCLFFDASDGSLWSETRRRGAGDTRTAFAGIAGWVARTGLSVHAPCASDDPRWHPDIDDPAGDARSELLVQAVIGEDGQVHAVLVAARDARPKPLDEAQSDQLARFAALLAPMLSQLSDHVHAKELADAGDGDNLFRREAIAASEPREWGEVVRVSPVWVSRTYWVLVVVLICAALFICLVSVPTYSSGPAVVRSTARTAVTVRTSGNVTSVDLSDGDLVTSGDVIARLDDADQRAAVERIGQEFETQVRNHLLDSTDQGADTAVRTLRLEHERALTALAERQIVAPTSGIVSDLRIRPGQHVEPGNVAVSILGKQSGLELLALLPGEDRPRLAPGMPLRLEITGYRYAYQSFEIESVSSEVIGPSEARRVLGIEVAEGLPLGASVVLVRARIPTNAFVVDDRKLEYHDGMRGNAEVRVEMQPMLVALIPGLRRLL